MAPVVLPSLVLPSLVLPSLVLPSLVLPSLVLPSLVLPSLVLLPGPVVSSGPVVSGPVVAVVVVSGSVPSIVVDDGWGVVSALVLAVVLPGPLLDSSAGGGSSLGQAPRSTKLAMREREVQAVIMAR
jgi:hypothetical protein